MDEETGLSERTKSLKYFTRGYPMYPVYQNDGAVVNDNMNRNISAPPGKFYNPGNPQEQTFNENIQMKIQEKMILLPYLYFLLIKALK